VQIQALVERKRRIRVGRGFSREELRKVNLSVKEALNLGIPVDIRRSTRHNENVEILRSFLKKAMQNEKTSQPAKTATSVKIKKKSKDIDRSMLNLTQVPGIGVKRAQQLKNAGIDSIEKLMKADPKEISKKLQVAEKTVSRWITNTRQVLSQE